MLSYSFETIASVRGLELKTARPKLIPEASPAAALYMMLDLVNIDVLTYLPHTLPPRLS